MLDPEQVLASDIVANSTMNRGRGLTGVNSYARELGFDPLEWLATRRAVTGSVAWYDVCCGEGHALRQAHDEVSRTPHGDAFRFHGADLIGPFPAGTRNFSLAVADVLAYDPGVPVDLITCVHGLHYLGDKLGFLEHAYRLLASGGMIIGHLDLANVRLRDCGPLTWRDVSARPRSKKISMTFRRHVITIKKTQSDLSFGLRYLGATVSETPNCTGIAVMDSWYERTS